jgi:cell division protein FtsQ
MQMMAQTQHDEEMEPGVNHLAFYQAVFSILFTAFVAWSVYFLLDPGTLPIKQVRIEGEFSNLSAGKLHDLVSHSIHGNFFHLDVAAVRNALLVDPWVRDVTVQRIWPDTISVYVTEQVAVARWNETGLLNRAGQYFAPAKNTFPVNLPLLEGPEGTEAIVLEKYFFLGQLLQPRGMSLDVLRLDERRAWWFRLHSGLQVELGRENFEERATRFAKIVTDALGSRIPDAGKIDMRYPNGYAVLWKQGDTEIQTGVGAL